MVRLDGFVMFCSLKAPCFLVLLLIGLIVGGGCGLREITSDQAPEGPACATYFVEYLRLQFRAGWTRSASFV